jgi:ATP-dependent helicase HrpA
VSGSVGPTVTGQALRTELAARLDALTVRDRHRLAARLERAGRRGRRADPDRLERDLAAAEARVAARLAAVPPELRYPPELPVSEHRAELLRAVRDHQVVVVAGETGSGKTTQLPKICLELGLGVRGMIGHTQPRRIAARTVAERVAEELSVPLGGAVGYAVRFDDRVSETTLVKLMTDGVLLAELPRDRLLRAYEVVIVDEAHERSLNIDFLLGYLAQLLPRRPDLKVLVTSATIDTARFSAHFGGAPVVEVSGRSHPVEVRWRPPQRSADGAEPDQADAIADAVEECIADGIGDILVFLSGEREIRDATEVLRARCGPGTDILPLYARLSAAEQHRVFRPHPGRRVVLATNVAETSITVPGIRYVVDPGLARVSRYNPRTKVQRLPIERISQASADQRAGRCGRLGPGVCIRLYDEEDFESRPRYSDPEIQRTNLASVLLQMAALGLGPVESFPFVDPPDRRAVRAAVGLLEELGALRDRRDPLGGLALTATGRRLARIPVDPRLGRMILAAGELGCLNEVVVLAAALSIQDPREVPADRRAEAVALHRRFADPDSDFVTYLNLWDHLRELRRSRSGSGFRRQCRREYLSVARVREWEDLCTQLRAACRDQGLRAVRGPLERSALHRALLAGLLSHIGVLDDAGTAGSRSERASRRRQDPVRTYRGARGTRFVLDRSSALASAPPRWVVAAELVETTRLRARTAARIEPGWVEELAAGLVVRSYTEAHWDRRRASTVAFEQVSLYGLPVVRDRRVDYSRLDPALARRLFIRHALVEGDWDATHRFLADNRSTARAIVALEDRIRRRDLLVDDDRLEALYDERIPPEVTNGRRFDRWWRRAQVEQPELLRLGPAELVDPGAGRIRFADFPDVWPHGDLRFPLSYVYDPTRDDDGVSVHVPLGAIGSVPSGHFDWHVPGFRGDVVAGLLRTLPKEQRRAVAPAAETAAAFAAERGPEDGALGAVLADWLASRVGLVVDVAGWDLSLLPTHLRPRIVVEDGAGRPLASSRDLAALRHALRGPLKVALRAAAGSVVRPPSDHWSFGRIEPTVRVELAGTPVLAYPGLAAVDGGVGVGVFADVHERDRSMWVATRRLLATTTNPPVARAAKRLPPEARLGLTRVPHASLAAFLEDVADAALDQLLASAGGPVWDDSAWAALHDAVASGLPEAVTRIVTRAALAVSWAATLQDRLDRLVTPSLAEAVADMRDQLDRLVAPGFVTRTGADRLIDLVRYLRAMQRRLDLLVEDPVRDRAKMATVRRLQADLDRLTIRDGPRADPGIGSCEADRIRWMIEELRVSLWAQSLGTSEPVSEARVRRALAAAQR